MKMRKFRRAAGQGERHDGQKHLRLKAHINEAQQIGDELMALEPFEQGKPVKAKRLVGGFEPGIAVRKREARREIGRGAATAQKAINWAVAPTPAARRGSGRCTV